MDEPPASKRSGIVRLSLVPLVLIGEYELLAIRFDGEALSSSGGAWAAFGSVGVVAGLAITIAAAGALRTHRWAAGELSRIVTSLGRFDLRWGALHVVAYVAFYRCSAILFGENHPARGAWAIAWLACGSLTAGSLVRFAVANAAGRIAHVVLRVVIAGLALGTFAWVTAVHASDEWPRLAHLTLSGVSALLGVVSNDVATDESRYLVGADGFGVEISAPCSGIEGMALVFVFVSAYLFTFRDRLRFPSAFVLLPISMIVAFAANVLRIVALILVGAHVSADVAFGGFHSQAGWVMFCGIALSFVAIVEQGAVFQRGTETTPRAGSQDLTHAYLLPELTLLAVSLCTSLFAAGVDFLYPVRVICAIGVLLLCRKHFSRPFVTPSWGAILLGAGVFGVWLLLSPRGTTPLADELRDRLTEWSLPSRSAFVFVRVLGSVLVVPVTEELAFRGYVQRRFVAEDFASVSFRRVTAVSVLATALCFGALHQAVVAGAIASLAYSGAAYLRGRLMDAVAAHATTNALIAIWVLVAGRWDLWT